jgi:hypothetical protein
MYLKLKLFNCIIELTSQMVFSFRSHSNDKTDMVLKVEERNDVRNGAFFFLRFSVSFFLNAHEHVGEPDEGRGMLKQFFLFGVAADVGEIEFSSHVHDTVPFNDITHFFHHNSGHQFILFNSIFEHILTTIEQVVSRPEGSNSHFIDSLLFGDFSFFKSALDLIVKRERFLNDGYDYIVDVRGHVRR